MACFIVPAAEAVVVTAAYIAVKHKEKKLSLSNGQKSYEASEKRATWSGRLSWLMGLLWGGSLLLAFEHFWHGEVVPFPPFLAAMSSPADTAEMLHEMSTAGVAMAILVTVVWGAACVISAVRLNNRSKAGEKA